MMWQPIETAPKDGKPVLLIVKGYQPVVGQWDDCAGWWYSEDNQPPEDWDRLTYRPTHWMPLPAPPS